MPEEPKTISKVAEQSISSALKEVLEDRCIRSRLEIECTDKGTQIVRFEMTKNERSCPTLGGLVAATVLIVAVVAIVLEIRSLHYETMRLERIEKNGISVTLPGDCQFSAHVANQQAKDEPIVLAPKKSNDKKQENVIDK